ncbi:MAG: hypothetical protein HKN58_07765 [Xanthomonadales bacterium]|nr:hypothetical protein [Xanthomonadales bacterium]
MNGQIAKRLLAALVLVPGLVLVVADARAGAREEVAQWLKNWAPFISCGPGHFIYGVGAPDGSYVERVFYAADSGPEPVFELRFRDPFPEHLPNGADFDPLRFELEIQVTRVRHAVLRGGSWTVGAPEWESALRFKYTNWFGTVSRQGGQWDVDWDGYRRPQLPESMLANPEAACGLFAEVSDSLVHPGNAEARAR